MFSYVRCNFSQCGHVGSFHFTGRYLAPCFAFWELTELVKRTLPWASSPLTALLTVGIVQQVPIHSIHAIS